MLCVLAERLWTGSDSFLKLARLELSGRVLMESIGKSLCLKGSRVGKGHREGGMASWETQDSVSPLQKVVAAPASGSETTKRCLRVPCHPASSAVLGSRQGIMLSWRMRERGFLAPSAGPLPGVMSVPFTNLSCDQSLECRRGFWKSVKAD